jgi:hypothetical protein
MVELFYLISMEQHADVTFNNVVAQKGGQSRETGKGNQQWTIQRNWQH